MAERVRDFRIAFTWTETNTTLLQARPPAGPLSLLGRSASYIKLFNEVRGGQGPSQLSLPWPRPSGQRFWTYYLGGRTPGTITGDIAWKALVPFRQGFALGKVATVPDVTCTHEALYYPHGAVYTLSATLHGEESLRSVVERVRVLRREKIYSLPDGADQDTALTLSELASAVLCTVRDQMLGTGAQAGTQSVEPFVVATLVAGRGLPCESTIDEDGSIHRFLEGVASGDPTWETRPLTRLSELDVPLKPNSLGRLLYAINGARVVWHPQRFTAVEKGIRCLGCYHRNLTLGSAHVESLLGFAAATVQQMDVGLAPSHKDCARYAAGLLGRLYGGDPDTYRSRSLKAQIGHPAKKPAVNKLRERCNMPPLTDVQG